MPASQRAAAVANSLEIQEVQDVFLTIQRNTIRLTGRRIFWTRAAISRRIGRVNVAPVDPDIRSIVSKAPKSLCELP